MLQQIAIPLGNLPINIVCLSNGQIGFVQSRTVGVIYTNSSEGKLGSIITDENIKVFDKKQEKVYSYGTAYEYKQDALLLQWLIEQGLVTPQF